MDTKRAIRSILVAAILWVAFPRSPAVAQGVGGCDAVLLQEAKAVFQALKDRRRDWPASVSDEELRDASAAYIFEAELCYEERFAAPAETGRKIDDGGVWMPGHALVSGKHGAIQPKHNLTGTKWGAGTSFLPCCDNQDASGPRSPGGTVTYSYMPAGMIFAAEPSPPIDTNTPISGLATFDPCFYTEIENAFAAWSAVADITFVPVTDGGGAFNVGLTGNIRIGSHTFDGAYGTLAHAFFPPPNGAGAAGDLHFDIAEDWQCSAIDSNEIDFGIVALHEIGHSIGLNHDTGGDTAVMDATYNGALTFGPLADDIIGIGEIYGGSPLGNRSFFGLVGIGTDVPQGRLDVRARDNVDPAQVWTSSSGLLAGQFYARTNSHRLIVRSGNFGPGVAGPFLQIGRNYHPSNPSAGTFRMNTENGTEYSLWIDASGKLRIGTAPPGPDTGGSVVGDQTSRLADKNILREWEEPGEALKAVLATRIYDFTFRNGAYNGERFTGPAIETGNEFFAKDGGKSLDEVSSLGYLIESIKALHGQIQSLEAERDARVRQIERLEARLAEMEKRLADQ